MTVKCNDDEIPLTREEALDIAMNKVVYYDAHGGLEVSIPFDEGVDWQKSQPCPSCQEKDKRIAELEKMNSDTETKALLFIEALEKVLGEKVKNKEFQKKLVEALLKAGA